MDLRVMKCQETEKNPLWKTSQLEIFIEFYYVCQTKNNGMGEACGTHSVEWNA
jgi:hypothetical protein